jgi:hypothetical protein
MRYGESGLEGGQEVAVKPTKLGPRRRADRLRTRLQRLQAITTAELSGKDQLSRAVAALQAVQQAGGRGALLTIGVRSSFITRRVQPSGEMSDAHPPVGPLPPVLELVSPNGIAQQLELVALFVAQTHGDRRPDGRVTTLGVELDTTGGNKVSWVDLIVPHAEHTSKAVLAADRRDHRLRQVKRALDTLTENELVELPNRAAARGKYVDFRLLDEGGPRPGAPLPYRVPGAQDPVIALPIDFFLQGWVYVLSKSEIALYLMLRHLRGAVGAGAEDTWVHIYGEDRLRRYGVGKDAYKGWWLLEHAGLIDVEVDPGRRGDGTVVDFDPSDPPAPHRFRLRDDGLAKPAGAAVLAAIAARLDDQEPVGVARVNTVMRDNLGDLWR